MEEEWRAEADGSWDEVAEHSSPSSIIHAAPLGLAPSSPPAAVLRFQPVERRESRAHDSRV